MTWLTSLYTRRVQLTVIDVEGKRITLRGLEGQTLVEVLAQHSRELGGDRARPRTPLPVASRTGDTCSTHCCSDCALFTMVTFGFDAGK